MLEITCCYTVLHLDLKRPGFTGEPMTYGHISPV